MDHNIAQNIRFGNSVRSKHILIHRHAYATELCVYTTGPMVSMSSFVSEHCGYRMYLSVWLSLVQGHIFGNLNSKYMY